MPAGLWLSDVGSKFGTFHNGLRINGPVACADGDVVSFGAHPIRLGYGPVGATLSYPLASHCSRWR